MSAFSTDELLFASKVYEMAFQRRRNACEVDATAENLDPANAPDWVSAWLSKNPIEEFLDSSLEDIINTAAFIDRRQNRP